jgi:hypothetical protein
MNPNTGEPEEKGFFEKVKESIEHFWTGDKDDSKENKDKVTNEAAAPAITPEAEKPAIKHRVTVVRNTTKTESKTSPAKAVSKKKAADKAMKANTSPATKKVDAAPTVAVNKRKTAEKAVKANTAPTAKVKAAPAKTKKAKTS